MRVENLDEEGRAALGAALELFTELRDRGDYLNSIHAIMKVMKMFEDDVGFHKILSDMRDTTKNLWRVEMAK